MYGDSAVVIEDAEILAIPKDDFLQMVSMISVLPPSYPYHKQECQREEDRLLNLAYNSLRKRVATGLVEITEKFNLKEQTMPIEISREEIAQYVEQLRNPSFVH
jgi:CRP-like cAMP-binding protein